MNAFRIAVLSGFFLAPSLALAQITQSGLDESMLWEQRLFEVESIEDRERPLELKVYGGLRYDSNLFRLSDDADAAATIGSSDKSENIYQLGAAASYQITPGRQKILLEGIAEQNWYRNFDNLDNFSNALRGEWGWQVGNDWNGTLGASHRRYLENFSNVQQNVRDMIDRERLYGSANYKPVSYLKFTVNLDWTEAEHSAESRQVLDYDTDTASFTVSWVTPAENTVGFRYLTADSRYPNTQVVAGSALDNSYTDNEYSVVASWRATGASTLNARLGRTERKFDQDASRNFSGPTWRVGYEWEPTGKTALELAVWRELTGFEDVSGNYMRSTGIGLIPAWSVMPKLILQGKLIYQNREYLGDIGTATGREDKESLLQVAAIWTPLRLTKLIFALEAGNRSSNQALADYDYQAVNIAAIRTF